MLVIQQFNDNIQQAASKICHLILANGKQFAIGFYDNFDRVDILSPQFFVAPLLEILGNLRDADWILGSILTKLQDFPFVWRAIKGFGKDLSKKLLVTLDRAPGTGPERRAANTDVPTSRKELPRDETHS